MILWDLGHCLINSSQLCVFIKLQSHVLKALHKIPKCTLLILFGSSGPVGWKRKVLSLRFVDEEGKGAQPEEGVHLLRVRLVEEGPELEPARTASSTVFPRTLPGFSSSFCSELVNGCDSKQNLPGNPGQQTGALEKRSATPLESRAPGPRGPTAGTHAGLLWLALCPLLSSQFSTISFC